MKQFYTFCISLFCLMPINTFAQQSPNWTPTIFATGETYMVNFQHKTGVLKYYTAVENIQIDGKMMTATVVRFSPSILNPGNPIQSADGFMVSPSVFGYTQMINLTGQPGSSAIQVEIYEDVIDPSIPGSVGNPQGKGTMVTTRPNVGGGINTGTATAPQSPGGVAEPRMD